MRRLDNIDLRLLRVFVTLTEAGSFSAAQVALNLSQSTLSGHLAALERALGGSLCLRGRQGFRLTAFGEATLRAARQLFGEIERFQQRIGEYNGELVGRLRVGIVDGVVSSPELGLQGPIGRYIEQARNVFIDLELGTPHELEMAVAEGRRDVVIGPFVQKAPGVRFQPLAYEPHALYCGSGHRLFGVDAAKIDQAAIEECQFSVRGYRLLEDLYRVGHPRASASTVNMEGQVMLVLSGHFVGFLPCHIGDHWVERGLMRALRRQTYQFRSQHFVAFRQADADRPIVRAFVTELHRQGTQGGRGTRRGSRAHALR